jgi:serine/threonine protein kinase
MLRTRYISPLFELAHDSKFAPQLIFKVSDLIPPDADASVVSKTYHRELQNLSLLRLLKHENLIELLCTFRYRERYYFVFPVAEHGDIRALLALQDRPSQFSEDRAWVSAIEGLASAVAAVHGFALESLSLHMKGCHHDLAPRNILVHGNKFMLCDFGLSRFKDFEASSSTSFKHANSLYTAPECQNLDGDMQSHRITASSDIWSFGCLLADILTYMVHGKDGVDRFKESRYHVVEGFESARFHHGPDQPSPAVVEWLEELGKLCAETLEPFVDLIRRMLSVNPAMRPNATQVHREMQSCSISAQIKSINEFYIELRPKYRQPEMLIEQARFSSWVWAVEHHLHQSLQAQSSELANAAFSEISATLDMMHDHLKQMRAIEFQPNAPDFASIRWQNTKLMNTLPDQARSLARSYLETAILDSGSPDVLEATKEALEISGADEGIAMLLAVRKMTLVAQDHALVSRPELQLKKEKIFEKAVIAQHSIARYGSVGEADFQSEVIVEWLHYNAVWSDEIIGQELFIRIRTIAELLASAGNDKFTVPSVLQCKGFFHDPTRFAFGLVYKISPMINAERQKGAAPITLQQMLGNITVRPVLDERFRFAHGLAEAVLQFHRLGWLHKALVPSNILFQPIAANNTLSVDDLPAFQGPYIIGFSRSREDEELAFTLGPGEDTRSRKYQHPWYRQSKVRFQHVFDYYSLGMVLLEIGMWDSIDSITASGRYKDLGPQEFSDTVVARNMSRLALTMGEDYAEAVRCCLTGFRHHYDMQQTGRLQAVQESNVDLFMAFKVHVVDKLQGCTI